MNGQQIQGQQQRLITDANSTQVNFLEKEEKEKKSLKLYYYMWLSRLFIFFSFIGLSIFLASSLSLYKLAPQITVEPFLIISQDSSEKIVRNEAIALDMASKEKLMEMYVKQYVIVRNTIINDVQEMKSRMSRGGILHFFSSSDVYNEFEKGLESFLIETEKNNKTQEVEITKIGRVGSGGKSSVWRVEFITYETFQSSAQSGSVALTLKKQKWNASVTAFFYPQRMFVGRRLINPLGFTVTRYSQDPVADSIFTNQVEETDNK